MQLAQSRHHTEHLLSKQAYLVSVYFPLGIFLPSHSCLLCGNEHGIGFMSLLEE